ncbi:MAG: glycosyltransferase family 2 protein [Chloroflexi bacterium]|nr:glycosyltransferase family 2 protein [Chloroflexota bacterium]
MSVIIPVYNGEKYLAEAIESILAQTFTDFELLIVDDGSEDASAEIIRSYEELDDRIRFFQHERNMGQSCAQNTGVAAAAGAYLTNMDCDDVSLPQRFEKQVNFLRSHSEIGAVGTCARAVNHDRTATLFDFNVPRQHALIAFNLFFGASFVGATVMTRREYIDAVGGYTPGKQISADLDLSMRLLWHTPIKFANLPEILMLYRQHEMARTIVAPGKTHAAERKWRGHMLQHLWGDVPPGAVERFQRLRLQHKLSWAEKRAAKKDLRRLIESLIAHNLVDADDRPLLLAAMNRRLEQASPRRWQQFCHWRRHRLRF